MAASAPALLTKIARVRPRIVCFVGMGIARVVLSALRGQAAPAPAPPPRPQSPNPAPGIIMEDATFVERPDAPPLASPRKSEATARKSARTSAPSPAQAKAKARSATAASPDVGLQPFKLVYHPPPSEVRVLHPSHQTHTPINVTINRQTISETLFFVSPSTSGRVTHFQVRRIEFFAS